MDLQVPPPLLLGEILCQQKLLNQQQLAHCLKVQAGSKKRLGRIIIDLGYVSEEEIAQALADQLGLVFVHTQDYDIDLNLLRMWTEGFARRFRAIPVCQLEGEQGVHVCLVDPTDFLAHDALQKTFETDIIPLVVTETDLLESIEQYYGYRVDLSGLVDDVSEGLGTKGNPLKQKSMALSHIAVTEVPVMRLLNQVLQDAILEVASDIHIEPQERFLSIRMRICGALRHYSEVDLSIAPALLLKIKLLSDLDIAQERLPQDGRFSLQIGVQHIDIRVATIPVIHGEAVVLRLLNRSSQFVAMENLGMPDDALQKTMRAIFGAHGLVLFTGPTSCGKTTSLYAVLSEVCSEENKVITIEDPVEYQLPTVMQIQVQESIGLGFDAILRSVLRLDPDVIMVGEIRDQSTAEMAIRASVTGHRVLSSMHTNNAASTLIRLRGMGVAAPLIATALRLIIAQRLVRCLCPECKQPYQPQGLEMKFLEASMVWKEGSGICFRAGGCKQCNYRGYVQQMAIFEALEMREDLADALQNNDCVALLAAARSQLGRCTLYDQVVWHIVQGHTSVSEAMKSVDMVVGD